MREKAPGKSDSSSRAVSPTTDGLAARATELTIFGASDRYRTQLENTEFSGWKRNDVNLNSPHCRKRYAAHWRVSGDPDAVDGVWRRCGNAQPGALIALFVFCALAALKHWHQ